jgi:hypothetical protein
MSKASKGIAYIGLAAALLAMANAGASAQEWRRSEYQYFKEPHKFGRIANTASAREVPRPSRSLAARTR